MASVASRPVLEPLLDWRQTLPGIACVWHLLVVGSMDIQDGNRASGMTTTWQRDKERSRNGGKSGNSPREGASQDSGHATSIREASGVDAMFVDAERGLEMIPLSRFSLRQMPREGVQLGFAAVDPGEIRRGVRELSEVLRKILKR